MSPASILFFSSEAALQLNAELALLGAEPLVVAPPSLAPPPDPRAWARAVSELALFNWLLLPSRAAAEALIEAIGAPPGATLRIASVRPAGEVLRAEGRIPEVEAAGLGALLQLMSGRLGRRQRALVPHAAVAGRRVGARLEELGAEVVCQTAYDHALLPEPDRQALQEAAPASQPTAAILAEIADAESLASYVRAERAPAALPIGALDQSCVDAAEDCGLRALLLPAVPAGGRLGPLLGEPIC